MNQYIVIFLIMLSLIAPVFCQDKPQTPCSAQEISQFDFWLGKWQLTWPGEQTGLGEGQIGKGENHIQRTFGKCVIEENFRNEDHSFVGQSWSVYSPLKKQWQQTWVDNNGAYLLFTGGMENGEMILKSAPVVRNGITITNRMVFSDIGDDSFTWHWQRSEDGGKTWKEQWTINYKRI